MESFLVVDVFDSSYFSIACRDRNRTRRSPYLLIDSTMLVLPFFANWSFPGSSDNLVPTDIRTTRVISCYLCCYRSDFPHSICRMSPHHPPTRQSPARKAKLAGVGTGKRTEIQPAGTVGKRRSMTSNEHDANDADDGVATEIDSGNDNKC